MERTSPLVSAVIFMPWGRLQANRPSRHAPLKPDSRPAAGKTHPGGKRRLPRSSLLRPTASAGTRAAPGPRRSPCKTTPALQLDSPSSGQPGGGGCGQGRPAPAIHSHRASQIGQIGCNAHASSNSNRAALLSCAPSRASSPSSRGSVCAERF